MKLDLVELLDSGLKGPTKAMLNQVPLMSFNDLPAAFKPVYIIPLDPFLPQILAFSTGKLQGNIRVRQ